MRWILVLGIIAGPSTAEDPFPQRRGFSFGNNKDFLLGASGENFEKPPAVALHPVEIELFHVSPISNLTAGMTHALALTTWGSLFRWGRNGGGQLGGMCDDTVESPEMMVLLPSTTERELNVWSKTAVSVAAGSEHTLVLAGDSEVYAWGDNTFNQLGVPIPVQPPVYHPPPVLRNVTRSRNATARNTTFPRPKPVVPAPTINATHNSTTGTSAGARDLTSLLHVASEARAAVPSSASPTHTATPVRLPALGSFTVASVHARMRRSALLTGNGQVWVWGDNRDGLIGVQSDDKFIPPTMVDGAFGPIAQLQLGMDFFVALDDEGRVWVWGDNSANQLGLGRNAPTTVDVPRENEFFRGRNISGIISGYQHTILWSDNDGRMYAFGDNEFGQLGQNDMNPRDCPVEVEMLRGVAVACVAAGRGHTVAVTAAGGVLVWGLNSQGQLGMGDTTTRPLPTRLIALESLGLTRCAAGYATSFVWSEPL